MIRNAYSTPKGDVLMGATFTVGQLRNAYTENGGKLTQRHRRFLRRFIPPYTDGAGLGTTFAVLIPRAWALENIPQSIRAVLRPHFEVADSAWFAARPWIGDEASAVDPTAIDAELGAELDATDERDQWEASQ